MQYIKWIVLAALIVFVGWWGYGKFFSGPSTSITSRPDYYATVSADNPNPEAVSSDNSSGKSSLIKIPKSGWQLAHLIVALLLILLGAAVLHKGTQARHLWLGGIVLIGGVLLLLWRIGFGGLEFNLNPAKWNWIVVGGLVAIWMLGKSTSFTSWDDRLVMILSALLLGLSMFGAGFLGKYNIMTPSWWVLEVIWVVLVAEAIWKSQFLQARKGLRNILLTIGWAMLGVLS